VALWKEQGLLTTEESPIKHSREILKLLKAALLPKQIAVIHCPGHQRSEDQIAKGNQRAGMAVKEATGRPYVQARLVGTIPPSF
jgi:ribonuclease HI